MALPERYHIDALRKWGGDGLVTYPDADTDVRRIERVFRVDRGTPPAAYNVLADPEYATAKLIEQYIVGGEAQQVEIFQAFQDLPGSTLITLAIADSGANQTTEITKVVPGSATPAGGLLVQSDQLAEVTKALAIRTRVTVDEQPLLYGQSVDEATGITIGYTKQIVDAASAISVAAGFPYAEVQPVNKFKSILIISAVNEASLPGDNTWLSSIRHSFPDIIFDLQVLAATDGSDFALAMAYTRVGGYSGPCNARFTEKFMTSAQYAVWTAPTVVKFQPEGPQFFFYNSSPKIWEFRVPVSLHGAFTPTAAGQTAVFANASDIPATDPPGYSSGDWILVEITPEKWRLGVWKITIVEAQVP